MGNYFSQPEEQTLTFYGHKNQLSPSVEQFSLRISETLAQKLQNPLEPYSESNQPLTQDLEAEVEKRVSIIKAELEKNYQQKLKPLKFHQEAYSTQQTLFQTSQLQEQVQKYIQEWQKQEHPLNQEVEEKRNSLLTCMKSKEELYDCEAEIRAFQQTVQKMHLE